MEPLPDCHDNVRRLLEKGVDIPNPFSIDVGDDVIPDRISGDNVRIDAGCRIFGRNTLICPGVRLGREGPVTLENCQLGPGVELKGGYARDAAFLEGASMGLGHHVREGSLLEEQASGAHCVGLKQTILFPFVTLGSLINFCDCLMAGGTSRRNHSEVGSSYIHFNFTPDGEKATPSLMGDVPRGVMLNQPPIFLGGQGGMVGPLQVEYGNVIAAGTILRRDAMLPGKLVVGAPSRAGVFHFVPRAYSGAGRVVEKNIRYLANLVALEHWYSVVRRPFFEGVAFGTGLYNGALDKIHSARAERLKRLRAFAENMDAAAEQDRDEGRDTRRKTELRERFDDLAAMVENGAAAVPSDPHRDAFLSFLETARAAESRGYIETIQALPAEAAQQGSQWLGNMVEDLCDRAKRLVPHLKMFQHAGT